MIKNLVPLIAALLVALSLTADAASEKRLPTAMTGGWEGAARIIVTWCKQEKLGLKLTIWPDGTVSGTVGDATLRKARLESNRGWLGRKLNLKTDWIIRGELSGPIVAAEKIVRTSVSIPLNHDGKRYTGGLHTSGAKFGGKSGMRLSAAGLVMTRTR